MMFLRPKYRYDTVPTLSPITKKISTSAKTHGIHHTQAYTMTPNIINPKYFH